MTYLSPELASLGYTGVTGTTPYQSSTVQQVSTLQNLYDNALAGRTLTTGAANATQININFDGTQNNRDYPPANGETITNIGRITDLQEQGGDPKNTIYMSGIGAQTTLGNSPSDLESTPWKAGEIGNQILGKAYDQLAARIAEIRRDNPDTPIELNLAGFSRGGAEAVAFANLLNERGIPGLYPPGNVPINSLVLFDPVSQTDGELNVAWPTNLSNPALVFVASAENRAWFPAMPVDTGAIIVPVEAVHADVGGSFNADGVSAVTLKIARDYLTATGSAMDAIPADLQPNWDRIYIHNSAIDNYNNPTFGTIGEPTQTVGTNRYYEGAGLGSITMQDMLGRDINVVPVYEVRNGRLVLAGFVSKAYQTTTDEATGNVTESRDIIAYARDGKTITSHATESVTKNDAEQIIGRSAVDYAADGVTVLAARSMEWLSNGNLQTTTRDRFDNLVSVGENQTYEDGASSETVRHTDGRITRTNTDENGTVTSRASIQYFEEDNSSIETITYADGRIVKLSYDGDGNLLGQQEVASGSQTLQNAIGQYGGTLLDALTLVKAIQSGEPLPVAASGLKIANDLSNLNSTPNLNLSGAAYAASGILSLMSLDAALERGDTLGAATAGAQAVTFGATAYANFVGQESLSVAIEAEAFGAASGAIGVVSEALPYLSIINSIANGDMVGAAIGVVALCVPVIGWAYAVYSIITSLFSDGPDIPDPWGNGHYQWDGNGITFQAVGETGGKEAVENVMDSTLATLNALIERERQQNPGSQLGIIPNRMPSVGYDMSGFRYTNIDPLSGAETHPALRFDTNGRPYNAEAGTPESYQSIVEGMVRSALSRSAIAPLWEVETARIQTDAGDPKAGLTEEERAGRDGQLAAPITGTTQTFRPVALDLDGDGIETTGRAHGVAFDVDDSGYLKQTAWVNGDDALLVLDRNFNGQFDSGREIFSNGAVALSRRGLAGMVWVDSDYDGKLTATDPVWNELKVWRDLDQDGAQDSGEVQGLDAVGVTELNYTMGTFTQNGTLKQLASPDLEADKDGTRVTVVQEGILVQASSNGHLSLLVTRIDDKTAVEANRDGVTGYEDVEIIVNGVDLLANDTLGGILGRDLTITGLTNLRHGTGFVDANGFIHFTPEANYAGEGAGFDYIARANNGQEGTATVDITLQNVNDAPTLDHVDHSTQPVYGYTPVQYSATDDSGGGGGQYIGGGNPIYEPYAIRSDSYYDYESGNYTYIYTTVFNPPVNQANMEYHTTPVAYEDSGSGHVNGTDIDDAASSLTYEIASQPQYGAVSLNSDGTFQYTSWKESGVPSDRIIHDGQYAGIKDGTLYYPGNLPSQAVYPTSDVFQVKITDPHGASTIQSISVPHYGPYLPPTPQGGGGGKKPIAIDLNGNGFDFVNVDDSNVFFDVNGDGRKHRTSWVGKDDGLLAYDIDGDGKIDKAGEISFTRYKDGAQSDLEGLSAFDTNGDGRFDAADDKWAKFGVWQDANQNGVTDPGEFRTLSEMGITVVSLTSDGKFEVTNGQTVRGVGSMTTADGSQMGIADVTFAYSNETQIPQSDGTMQTVNTSPFSPSGEEINGTEGKDLILGKNGNNIVKAMAGDDVIFEDGGNDIIDGGEGNDLIYAGADNDVVMGGVGNDAIYAGLGSDVAFGGDGHDAIFAEGGNDVVFGGTGNDLIAGGSGNDVLSGDDGDDQVYGESGNDALFGGAGDDELSGMDGNDRLDGGQGNDLLDGGAGADEMTGGAGDDTYVVDDAGDTVTELVAEGNDTVRTTFDGYTLGANVENLTLIGTANLSGYGNELDNVLAGSRGNNTLVGGDGNDKLDGGLGSDALIGGAGEDTYVVDNAGDLVVEAAGEGTDTVKASVSYALSANVENLTLTGTGAINATGNTLDNHLVGNDGDNTLDGGVGVDFMAGGRGNDTYLVGQAEDMVDELSGDGVDTVVSGIDYALGANVENLVLTGTVNLTGTGNELANVIVGNAGNNLLDGAVGADTLVGGAGNDSYIVDNTGDIVTEGVNAGTDAVFSSVSHTLSVNVENLILTGSADIDATGNDLGNTLTGSAGSNRLDGGTGADTMAGGLDNDTYVVDQVGDAVVELANEGLDTVTSSVSYSLGANVENLVLIGTADLTGTGNELINVLVGNAGNNVLDGAAGADTLVGGAGNDGYIVDNAGDTVTEGADAGTDAVFSSATYTLSANVESLILTGTADTDASGNELVNILTGNAGSNRLDGGAGADTMAGGLGNDTYVVDQVGDVVIELANEGLDTVVSGISYTLGANVENLALAGTADLTGTGNELANTLIGNAGNNRLDGGSGADTMAGSAGNDTYVVDDLGDTVVEVLSGGIDSVLSSDSFVLPEHVENLTLTGNAAINGTGNALDNRLVGNAAANVLDGAAGADDMTGGAGDDIYYVDTVGDRVTEAVGGGYDTVRTTVSLTAPDNVERIELLGKSNLNATGNALDNVLVGNSGANRLDGGLGADAMLGGAGDDIYIVDNAGDTVTEGAAEGSDTVFASLTYILSANVENLTLSGSANINGNGNALNNVLIGNTGRNILDGGAGGDAMAGGAGDDDYIVDNASDTVTELAFGGIDTVFASVSYVLPEHVENLTLTGNGNIGAVGNGLDNHLTGNTGDNFISGGAGNDLLDGQAGNDTLDGGQGNDVLIGGTGNDTYLINLGDGLDQIADAAGTDAVRFGAGLSLDNVALRISEDSGTYTAHVRVLNAGGCEQPDQGFDFAVSVDRSGQITSPIEQFQFADGSVKALDDLLIKTRTTYGTPWSTAITTGRDDDIIIAGPRNSVIRSGSGNDIVYAGPGGDTVNGEGGNDYLQGGTGNDTLDGACGIDVMAGSNGRDTLRDMGGNNALFGGSHNDQIEAGAGNDFVAGGMHDDTIQAGAGANVIAFNRGDGQDIVLPGIGASNTLSLGGGIEESDLSFKKSGLDLVLSTGGSSQITLKDWYASANNQTVDKLQVVEAAPYYSGGHTNSNGWDIDSVDFKALVQHFDAARAANSKLSQWSLMNGLLDAHLENSDSAALGGELATRYAAGGESAISLGVTQDTLKDANFGSQAQTVGSRFDATVCGYRLG